MKKSPKNARLCPLSHLDLTQKMKGKQVYKNNSLKLIAVL